MPHEDYMKRLINATQHPSGARPLINRNRVEASEEQRRSPRLSPRLSKTNDKKRTANDMQRHNGNAKQKKSPLAARALAALESDEAEDDSDSELSRDEQGGRPPRSRSPATNIRAMSAAANQRGTPRRLSSPPRKAPRISKEAWVARVKKNWDRYEFMSSPCGSVASSHHNASASHSVGSARNSNNNNSGQSPASSIGSARNSGRSVTDVEILPRIPGQSVTNTVAATGTSAVAAQNGSQNNGSHPPMKPEMCSPPRMDMNIVNANHDPKMVRANLEGMTSSGRRSLIDLTGNSTETGDSVGENELPTPKVNNTQALYGIFVRSTPRKPRNSDEEQSDVIPCKEMKPELVVVLPSAQRQNLEKAINATESSNVPKPGERKINHSNDGERQPMLLPHINDGDQPMDVHVADSISNEHQNVESQQNVETQQDVESQQNVETKASSLEKPQNKSPTKFVESNKRIVAMALLNNEDGDQSANQRVAGSTSNLPTIAESNEPQQNDETKARLSENLQNKSPTKSVVSKKSTVTMSLPNNEDSDQTLNQHVAASTPNEQQNAESNTRHNDETKASSPKKPQNKSPSKSVGSKIGTAAKPLANSENGGKTLNQLVAEIMISDRQRKRQQDEASKACSSRTRSKSPPPQNVGSKKSIATLLVANNENGNQTMNKSVSDSIPNEQQNTDPNKQKQNVETKGCSPKKPKNKSPIKRKSSTLSRKSSTSKKASAKKDSVTPTCSLAGALSYSLKDGIRCHIIRGLWQYENHTESTPQRFLLRQEVPSDGEPMPLTTGGIFSGSFIYQSVSKEKPPTTFVIQESEVNLSFTQQEGELQSFAVNGNGQNQVGKFDIDGTATKMPAQESYIIQMRKKYTERFPSPMLPTPGTGEMGNKKRKFSMVDVSTGSDSSGAEGDEKQTSSEGEMSRAISISSRESSSFIDTDVVNRLDGTAANSEKGGTLVSSQIRGKAVLDVVFSRHMARRVTKKKGEKKCDSFSRLISLDFRMLLPSEYCPSSTVAHQKDAHISHRSSQEFGALQGMCPSFSTGIHTWNARNVKPLTPMILDFFDSVGIVNVQDFLEADTDNLSLLLMTADQFKAACAFEAWRSRLNRHNSISISRSFRDLYRLDFAKENILTWKRTTEAWYKKIAPAESHAQAQANDTQVEAVSDINEAISGEDQAQHENIIFSQERSGTEFVEGSSEIEDAGSDDPVPLENILSSYEALALKDHCNIHTAQELLAADSMGILRRLAGVVGVKFPDRLTKDHEGIAEGMIFSWLLRAQGAVQVDDTITRNMSSTPPSDQGTYAQEFSPKSTPTRTSLAFQTPLSYFDLQFIKSQRISSDGQLAYFDPFLLAHRYADYYSGKTECEISRAEAIEVTKKWRQGACSVLGISSKEDDSDSLQENTRLDSRQQEDVMHSIPNLCVTVADEENQGLPTRTIFTYDDSNEILYEFSIRVKDSLCSSDAGNGAFLTYKGAKVLKVSSKWKTKSPRDIPRLPQTRRPLEALFSTSGATVNLRGVNLHGDEYHYGPERVDSVGLYREYRLDDFVDADDNISFSSNHVGCALIELDRYAPLLPEDRKTHQLFSIKDFIFSHEPSSWRFDVAEKLNGCPQVVDFTDDTTGAPHAVAEAHMSMYVNEVGHNANLVENVHCLGTPRSVSYYIDIDKPMSKGETTELLVNYKGHYETMRERRGYGKANLLHGVKSDAHDITRVQRNLSDRFLMEESIFQLTEDEILRTMDFIKTRVWDGLKAATSTLKNCGQSEDSNLLRQCIARRRLGWLSKNLRSRLHDLMETVGVSSLPFAYCSDSEERIFQEGMLVYVHNWPPTGIRKAYTGLATINSISKDKWKRNVFEVSDSNGRYIESVPAAVVTLPTDDDFKYVPNKRIHSNWVKWKKEQDLPLTRQKMLRGFDAIEWEQSFVWNISAASANNPTSEMQTNNISRALKWEISEEILFLLVKHKRFNQPFEESKWCPLSVSLQTNCLHLIADFLLLGRDKQILSKALMGLTRDAANTIKNIVNKNATATANQYTSLGDLALLEKSSAHKDVRALVVDALHINRVTIEDFVEDPQPQSLDLEWYLVHQVILAVHPLASLIDWGPGSGNINAHYSIETLCDEIGLKESSYLNFYSLEFQNWHPLLCT